MRSTTNLHWPIEPFGATQRPFAADRPMLAALTVGPTEPAREPAWACVVYLYTDSTRTLLVDDHLLNVGFDVVTGEPGDRPAAMAHRLDEILLACYRHAKILAGHDLTRDLATLAALGTERRLPGVDRVRQRCNARHTKERGAATIVDTAYDLGAPAGLTLDAACAHAALSAATLAVPADAPLVVTVRRALIRTLAVALLAARACGRYSWTTPLDLDALVTDMAWDHLDQLAQHTPTTTGS